MRKIVYLFALLIFSAIPANAQGVREGDERPVISAQFPGGVLYSVPFATINFCNSPNVGVPCVNKATTYTDLTLSTPCPTSTQIVLAGTTNCIGTTDGFGNWGVNVAVGTYTYTIQLPSGASLGPFTVTLASGGGGGGSGTVNPGNAGQIGGYLTTSSTISGLPNILFNGGILTLGSSGILGGVVFGNTASGTLSLNPATGPLGNFTLLLPNSTNGTLVEDNLSSFPQFSFPFWNGLHLLGLSPAPTTNCNWLWASNVTANVAVQPSAECPGILPRAISGSTTSDLVSSADNIQKIVHYFAATGAVNETLPTPTTLGIPDFTYKYCNDSPQTDIITPTTWTIQAGSNAPASSLSVASGNCYIITIDPAGNNWLADISGVGLGNVTATSLTLGRVAIGGGSLSLLTDNGDMKCSAFSGADWGVIITACLNTMGSFNSISGVADARGVSNSTTASVNPFLATSIPNSGRLLMGPGTYLTNFPIVDHGDWSIRGTSVRGVDGQTGTTIKAGASFQGTYTTGTITVGTPGAAEIITGSGTTWTASMVGCAFYGANGGANSTYGMIVPAALTATTLTVGFGTNIGTGAAAASAYSIACPLHAHGSGATTAGGAQFGMKSEEINYDCNNVAGCIGDLNWYGQQGTCDEFVGIHNFNNIGLDIEGTEQQSCKWKGITVSAGSSATTGTLLVVVRGNGQDFGGFETLSTSKGASSVQPTVGIDDEENSVKFGGDSDFGGGVTELLIGGNVTCPVSCASIPRLTNGTVVDGVYCETAVTTCIQISNAFGTSDSTRISDVFNNGPTNALIDSVNSCTTTESRLGLYVINRAGKIGYSTSSVAGCKQVGTTQVGTCTLGTNCSVTFAAAFVSTPICQATDQTNINATKVVPSNTGVVITGNATDVIAWECTGNPN